MPCPSSKVCPGESSSEPSSSTSVLRDHRLQNLMITDARSARFHSATIERILVVKPPLLLPILCGPFFGRTRTIRMNFDMATIQHRCFNSFGVDDLRFEMFFDTIENANIDPVAKTVVNTVPVAELFRQGLPFTSVFSDGVQGLKKRKIINFNIASLFGKQVLYPFDVFLCPFHDRSIPE